MDWSVLHLGWLCTEGEALGCVLVTYKEESLLSGVLSLTAPLNPIPCWMLTFAAHLHPLTSRCSSHESVVLTEPGSRQGQSWQFLTGSQAERSRLRRGYQFWSPQHKEYVKLLEQV